MQRLGVEAWLALAEGREEEALALMRSAADLEDSGDKPPTTPGSVVPARELLGEMLLEVGRPADALAEFEGALEATPNRFRSLYGAARAADLAGDVERARQYYAQLLEVSRWAEGERPEAGEAKRFLAKERTGG
jgi:tetratricopeptide (TPR) repeat protein